MTEPSAAPRSTTTGTGGAADSTLVAYRFEDDIWLYDGRSRKVTRLTSDGYQRTDLSPRFRDRRHVTFVSMSADKDDSTLVEVDLTEVAGGTRLRLVHRQLPGVLRGLHDEGWSRFLARLGAVAAGADPAPYPSDDPGPRLRALHEGPTP